MSTHEDARAAVRAAVDTFRAAAISAAQAVLDSPHAVIPGLAADVFYEEIRAAADALEDLADGLAPEQAAVVVAERLAVALDAVSVALPSTVESDFDTSRAVIEASAEAFRAIADALDGRPATVDGWSLDAYQAAWARASARQIAHALDDLLAARDAYVDEPNEINSNAETAAYFIVRDIAAALAGDHSQLLRNQAASVTFADYAHIFDDPDGEQTHDESRDQVNLRVEDLHAWIAEPAGPLLADGHHHAAVMTATATLESRWRSLLGLEGRSLGELGRISFDPRDPTGDEPRLRVAIAGPQDSVALRTANDYAQHLARVVARLRNLAMHHPPDSEPPKTETLEQLTLVSRLAHIITQAEIVRAR